MHSKTLSNGFSMPVLGIGTWGMGGGYTKSTKDDTNHIAVLRAALELGITHIDTAELYGDGHAEELVREAIQGFDRKKLFITTKVKGDHLHHDDVIAACNRSLKRLGTDYIDLYLVHWPSEDVLIEETMRVMNDVVDRKLVRFIGLSNFSVKQMKEAQKCSNHPLVAHQVEYSLLYRNQSEFSAPHMESEMLPFCQKDDVMFIAWSPLARGALCKPGYKVLDEIAAKYRKTPAQVALNWLISKKNMVTIPKASSVAHVNENLAALGWKLEKEDIERLNMSRPFGS